MTKERSKDRREHHKERIENSRAHHEERRAHHEERRAHREERRAHREERRESHHPKTHDRHSSKDDNDVHKQRGLESSVNAESSSLQGSLATVVGGDKDHDLPCHTRWVGQEIPNIGTPVKTLMFRPTYQDDGHLKIVIEDEGYNSGTDNMNERVKLAINAVSAKLEELHQGIRHEIFVEQTIKKVDLGINIGSNFLPTFHGVKAVLENVGVTAGSIGLIGSATHMEKNVLHKKVLACSDDLATLISSQNAESKESAKAAGEPSYLSIALCEQSVSLNTAQALAIEEEIDPNNDINILKERQNRKSLEEKSTNRFTVFEFCPVTNAETVENVHSEDLQYDLPEVHFAELKIKKRSGKVRLIGSALKSIEHAVTAPFNKMKVSEAHKRAEIRNENGLPAYGDYVIRRFICLFRIPIIDDEDNKNGTGCRSATTIKPLIHLPPVYSHFDPNKVDKPMYEVMFPNEVSLGPGIMPPPMEYKADCRLNQEHEKNTYEVLNLSTNKSTVVGKDESFQKGGRA